MATDQQEYENGPRFERANARSTDRSADYHWPGIVT